MALPEPQRGLVISYAYLWHYEHRAGREQVIKNRPCVIVPRGRGLSNESLDKVEG